MKKLIFILLAIVFTSCKDDDIFNPDIQYGSVTDCDKNTYRTIKIGTREWMAENLRTTRYNDGTDLIHDDKGLDWSSKDGSYCWYENDKRAYRDVYGALYNRMALSSGKLCPAGWHVPDIGEWETLANYLIDEGYNYDGTTSGNKIAQSLAATAKWEASEEPGSPGHTPSANNRSGFSAVPAGYRDPTHGWNAFKGIGTSCGWWTSTDIGGSFALHCSMDNHYMFLNLDDPDQLSNVLWSYGFSVRCVKD